MEWTHYRIYYAVWEYGDEWHLDAADNFGRYSDECWTFETWDEALAALPEFREAVPLRD